MKSAAGRTQRRWALVLFRILVITQVLLTLFQSVLIGGFLGGGYDLLAWHRNNSNVIAGVAILMMIVAVLMWWHRTGSGWLALVSLVFFGAVAGQTVMGYKRVIGWHVPIGVLIVAALVVLLVWAWRLPRQSVREPVGQAGHRGDAATETR